MSNDLQDMKAFIAKVADANPLDEDEAEEAFQIIMNGNATPAQIGGFLMSLRVRGSFLAKSERSCGMAMTWPRSPTDCRRSNLFSLT